MATAKKPVPLAAVQAAAPAPEPVAKPGRKKLLLPIIGLFVLGSAGGGGWYYLKHRHAATEDAAPVAEKKAPPIFLPIDQFTVNLSGGGGDRFLQIAFTLQVAEPKVADELKLQMPVVRSRLLMLLASKTAEELATTAGKQKLMGELLAEARAPLEASEIPAKGVDNLLFSAFVIQ